MHTYILPWNTGLISCSKKNLHSWSLNDSVRATFHGPHASIMSTFEFRLGKRCLHSLQRCYRHCDTCSHIIQICYNKPWKLSLLAWVSCLSLCQYNFSLCSTDSSYNLAVLVSSFVADAQHWHPGYHRDLITEQKNRSSATRKTSLAAENQHRRIFSKIHKKQKVAFPPSIRRAVETKCFSRTKITGMKLKKLSQSYCNNSFKTRNTCTHQSCNNRGANSLQIYTKLMPEQHSQ